MDRLTNTSNLAYVEELYLKYLSDPSSVPADWQSYFAKLNDDGFHTESRSVPSSQSSIRSSASISGNGQQVAAQAGFTLYDQLNAIIHAYRRLGHRAARIDPLNLRNEQVPELTTEFYGLIDAHLNLLVPGQSVNSNEPQTVREILQRLQDTYCGSIGVEFMHIEDRSVRYWLQERMEQTQNRSELNREERIGILTQLIEADTFEQFIRKKFLGAKSFSLEGAESLIPLLDIAIEEAGHHGIEEIVLAMAHRGRLNVLANVMNKSPREIFREFADMPSDTVDGSGDVKYHLGHSHDYKTRLGHKVHLSLCFNPSHLEFVNPVALGRLRAKQDRVGDTERGRGMALLIHGEAAFAGEGIVQESLNLSQLEGYTVGGSLHVIINNQIGFTTCPDEGRSSLYATDVVKMLQIPIFHINANDPEAVAHVVRLAIDFRQKFKQDAVIDMYCYRRWGHNEGDEPTFTQPMLYQAIRNQKSVRELYLERLIQLKCLTRAEAEYIETKRRENLEQELSLARSQDYAPPAEGFRSIWTNYRGGLEREVQEVETAIARERLSALLDAQTHLPEDFHPHPKIERALETRRKLVRENGSLDWSAAEGLAFASLAADGIRVRLTGQDSARGTFSQRHAVLHDFQDGHTYVPLQHVSPNQAAVEIYNSPLSEAGVLGFDYGYSLDSPDALVLWEAQFGDFSNAAQVIIDQFITSAEEKWHRLSGIVLLLPHGFEGMGPEHSSARLERFLQLGVKDNIQVVYPTTPAQYFHCLRRQALRNWRKPLVIMTPKSLLRHPRVISPVDEFANGKFQPVIPDRSNDGKHAPDRVILCSGKLYYDLSKKREELRRMDVPIVRLEQLYPLPEKALDSALASYSEDTPILWVQEEPENMGAWWYLHLALEHRRRLSVVSRAPSASPATGLAIRHKEQQQRLLTAAFGQLSTKLARTSPEFEDGRVTNGRGN